jgi:hypothetical protein
LIEALEFEIELFAGMTRARLACDPGYTAIRTIPGIGGVLAAVFVAEIGEVSRFPGPTQLASWAGLTPRHRESDTHVHRGRITRQGSRLVRWAAVESVQVLPAHTRIGAIRERVAARRGATSVSWPPPANNSSWSTTGCATTPSAHRCTTHRCTSHRPQHRQRRHEQPEQALRSARVVQVMTPGIRRGRPR